MDFPIKLMIPIFVIAIIAIVSVATHISNMSETNSSGYIQTSGGTNDQTPYIIETILKLSTPIPTPTPLYYEEFKYPTEPCSQSAVNFETHCMGKTKDEGYCEYWEYQYRKNCKFAQW